MNIRHRTTTSNRNQPVHWEHTINIQAAATGTTKGEELKRGKVEAFKTKTMAAGSVWRDTWCGKSKQAEIGSRSHRGLRTWWQQGWYQQQWLQHPRVLPCAWFIRLDQIRQPKLFEFQVFPLRVWFNCLAIQVHALFAMLSSRLC